MRFFAISYLIGLTLVLNRGVRSAEDTFGNETVVPGIVFQIVDENGNDVPEGKKGLLLYKSGTVCGDIFSNNTAQTICKEMGFSGAYSTESGYQFDLQDSLDIKLHFVQCYSEHKWSSCYYSESTNNCDHDDDVFLTCGKVDGGYSEFGNWSECSATCGGGRQTRIKTCTEPTPSHDGADCVGEASETQPCNEDDCPQCPDSIETGVLFQIVDGNGTDVPKDKEGLLLYKGGTVCTNNFDYKAAHSICKEMGFSGALLWGRNFDRHRYLSSLDQVQCIDDHCWSSCSYNEYPYYGCGGSSRVFLTCFEYDCPDWEFYEAALIQEENGTDIRSTNEGLLIVNFANKLSGEKMNVTVCPGNFNWYAANTFCRYFGNEQGMWDSKPNNLTLISETLLQYNGSVLLSVISCKDDEDENLKCDARISADSCDTNDSVWLNCNIGSDMWIPVVDGNRIGPVNPGTSYLNLRTDSAVGSGDIITVDYHDKEETVTSQDSYRTFVIKFDSPVKYLLRNCHSNYVNFYSNLPDEVDKHWVIKKRGYRIVIFCNGELVVNTTVCESFGYGWIDHWRRDVDSITIKSTIGVNSTATALSQSYYIEHVWEYERANLIKVIEGRKIINDKEGLLIATVVNKQTREEKNVTVCKELFNWHSAQLFCWSLGHHFSDWGSYPRNMKYLPENWRNPDNFSITIDEVSCKYSDTGKSDCHSSPRVMTHTCEYRDSIWLRCFSNTGCAKENQVVSNKSCTVTNIGGFLKNLCFDESIKDYFHLCANSNVTYVMGTENHTLSSVSSVCDNDPYVYQACGFDTKTTKQSGLCSGGPTDNTTDITCDDKCDWWDCRDEQHCGGYTYRIYCNFYGDVYGVIPWYQVCDGIEQCRTHGEDERDCDVKSTTLHSTCPHYGKKYWDKINKKVPILRNTRCSVFDLDWPGKFPYCYDYLDQTNCSDVNKVGGNCLVNDYMSVVSKYVVCGSEFKRTNKPVNLCDDNLEDECTSLPQPGLAEDCVVHKHRLCDGVSDCVDGSDETLDICQYTTLGYLKCRRGFNTDKNMPIPVKWLLDDQTDCLDGEDEKRNLKVTYCEEINEGTERINLGNKTCQDVFLCPGDSKISYVEFEALCDGINSCEVENDICTISRDFPSINSSAVINSCNVRDLCESMEQSENVTCHVQEFQSPAGNTFGVKMMINVPTSKTKVDCSIQYGEYYVFLSCMGLCLNSTCPLQNTSLDYDSCPGQYPGRIHTLANNSALTFVTLSDEGEYENAHFQCDNKKCVHYSQVCNLVDDCGDLSDERLCTNHLVCEDTKNRTKQDLISYSQRCDGKFDCFDLSDECNQSCGKEILANWVLKLSCWLLGLLASIFNVVMVTKVGSSIRESESGSLLCTRVLICLIGLGDLLIGVYLIVLSVFDSIILGEDYCAKQAEWLSGTACSVLGVISTTGSQLSLFSMTALSLIRMRGIVNNSMIAPTRVNKKAVIKAAMIVIGIVTASLSVALIPLVPALEDYFVKGFFYDRDYKLFIGFPNKIKHVKILQAYYKNESFSRDTSWTDIGEKVDAMFSHIKSYGSGSLNKSAVHFYGNDGVCLFKYSVRSDDPRRSQTISDAEEDLIDVKGNMIVWLMLGVNLCCFLFITVSYLLIYIKSRKSSRNSGQNSNPETVRRNRAMENRIALVIATDFACWVPFIIISGLHNLESIDATDWYLTFAMIVLPINSVVNPMLYDNTLREFFSKIFTLLNFIVQSVAVRFPNRGRYLRATKEAPEERQIVEMGGDIDKGAPADEGIMEI